MQLIRSVYKRGKSLTMTFPVEMLEPGYHYIEQREHQGIVYLVVWPVPPGTAPEKIHIKEKVDDAKEL
jgi:hypothetical protein